MRESGEERGKEKKREREYVCVCSFPFLYVICGTSKGTTTKFTILSVSFSLFLIFSISFVRKGVKLGVDGFQSL